MIKHVIANEVQHQREKYERDLAERQRKHLENIQQPECWQPCMHDQCQQCHGTGKTANGPCIHMISCPCPKCSPRGQL